MKASGFICGGRLTPEAMDLSDAANLFTISNFYYMFLKYYYMDSYFLLNDSGYGLLVMLFTLPGYCGSFWYNYYEMKGIIGWRSLIPFYRQMKRVKAVFYLS